MKSETHYERGFTLIEVVIVMFLFSVLLLGMLNIFEWHQKIYLLEQAEVRATGSIRSALNEMTRYIAQGNEIVGSRTINGQTYTTGGSAVIVKIPAINASDSVIPNSFDHVVYYISGTNLYQIIELGSGSTRVGGARQLGSVVSSLSFTYNNISPVQASSVIVDIQTTAPARGTATVSAHATDTIFLRNR